MSLTARQAAILDFVRQHLAAEGMPPTLQEIGTAFGLEHVNAVVKHLRALETKGQIALLPNRARGIRLVDDGASRESRRDDSLQLPLIGRVAAGQPLVSEASTERVLRLDPALFRLRPDYLLRVQGDSMRDDGILDGDLIGVHATPVAEHGQTVVARVGDGFTVKRLYRRGRQVRLLPRNAEHAPIDPDPREDFAIEGLFAGLIRPG
ncbi:transcriptional repressor LexA [Dyella sp.]|jgi:repressor LexA|uniref:transcriptional repressor LexA n=1 Tax=Dyella sp. TaxID=1869338 RepID=UPI002D76EB55|nr:transcriptional repressor LexA [Dyella sp.]HET6432403.1 transcriptional repressor LexA [Dyella sp.]